MITISHTKRATTGLLAGVMASSLTLMPLSGRPATNAPTIKLFPTTVLEEIKHTGNVALEMESGLQAVIARMDEQQKLFTESKCEGAEEDPGCEQLSRQLGATYLEMLDVMAEKLPSMRAAVENTTSSLEKRIRRELGQKNTSWSLQELLLTEAINKADRKKSPLRGRYGMRLSDRFNQYYKLVVGGGSQLNASLAVIASDIYLDMRETARLIERTEQEINRATLLEQLNQSFGTVTPEMQEIVAGVKAILFGEEEFLPTTAPPRMTIQEKFRSPLQL